MLLLDPCERVTGKRRSWLNIATSKGFTLYLLPWIIFNIADGILVFVKYEADPMLELLFRFIGFSVFAFISGVMVDRVGRKYPLILGLVMLGISYLFVGVAATPLSWVVMIFISSIAWSFFQNAYLWAVLGDLASPGSKERFYTLGWIVIFMVETSFRLLKGIFNIVAPANVISAVLGILIFLSIIPLIFAPETLPETQKRARRLRDYLKKVGDLIQSDE
jgi:MFS family permease